MLCERQISGDRVETSLKTAAMEAIQSLPAEVDVEGIIEAIIFRLKVAEGLRDAEAGRFVSDEEIKKKFGL